jgi:hypothetical protein
MWKALVTTIAGIAMGLAAEAAASVSVATPPAASATSVSSDLGKPLWIPSGSFLPGGKPVGYWVLPDGYRFRGTQDLSQDQVFAWADRLRREGEESAAPDPQPSPGQASSILTNSGAKNALATALLAALGSLFLVGYLYRIVRGIGSVGRARKYAAVASISAAPFCVTTLDALLRGMAPALRSAGSLPEAIFSARTLAQFDGATLGRMVGLGLWAILITGIAFASGWLLENRARVATAIGYAGDRAHSSHPQRNFNWAWLAVGALVLLGFCTSRGHDGQAGACRVEWDGRANPAVCD